MKEEFLEKLGLSGEAISAIMSEHNSEVNELKNCFDALKAENDGHRKAISSLESERDAFLSFRDQLIIDTVNDCRPSSKAARAELTRQLSECKDGKYKDIINAMKLDDPDAFLSDTSTMPIFSSPKSSPDTGVSLTYSKIR